MKNLLKPFPVKLAAVLVANAFFAWGTGGCQAHEPSSGTAHQEHAPAKSAPENGAAMNMAETSEYSRAMIQSMETMDHDMMAAPLTGDADHDFLAMMIPHHQGAIDMAKIYLAEGQRPGLTTPGSGDHCHAGAGDCRHASPFSCSATQACNGPSIHDS